MVLFCFIGGLEKNNWVCGVQWAFMFCPWVKYEIVTVNCYLSMYNEICVTCTRVMNECVCVGGGGAQYFLINICSLYWQNFLSTSFFVTTGLAESCCLCLFMLPLADIPTKSIWKDKNKSRAHQIMKQKVNMKSKS